MQRFARDWFLPGTPGDFRARAVDPTTRRRATAAGTVQARVVETEGATVVHLERWADTGAAGAALRVVGRRLRLVQTERWAAADATGAVRAQLAVTSPVLPLTVAAEIRVGPVPAAGSRYEVSGTVQVRLPGVGRAIERRVAAALLADMDRDLAADDGLAAGMDPA